MRKVIFCGVIVSVVLIFGGNFVLADGDYVPDEIIIRLKENQGSTAAVANIAAAKGATVKRSDVSAGFSVLKLPVGVSVEEAVKYYNKRREIEYAEPNHYVRASWSPNDADYTLQWHFTAINLAQAWDYDTTQPLHGGDPSIVVAVLDTGVAYENFDVYSKAPDFTGSYPAFKTGYDFVNNDTHANDDNGHGTHVASTISQSTDNNLMAAGIAFNTTIMPVKVLNSQSSGTDDQVASGITFAKDNGAYIMNMSIGSTAYSQTIANAVTAAGNAGVVMFAATGNGGADGIGDPEIDYPARYPETIAVGATRYHNNLRASYSNYGSGIDLVAPGGEMTEAYFIVQGDGVVQQSFGQFFLKQSITLFNWIIDYVTEGTSMATPHASGVAALLMAHGVPANNIRSIIDNSATDLGVGGYDYEYGHGLLNASNAFGFPTITSVSPSSGSNTLDTNITIAGTGFISGATANIGSTALTNVSVASGTSMTATVPGHLAAGNYDVSVTVSGKTTSASKTFTVVDNAPSDVSRLRVITKSGKVMFKWKNPSDWDFSKVKILRKNKKFPTDSSDGKKVFNRKRTSFTNKGLKKRKYYYKIFTYDTVGNYSSGVPVVVVPVANSVKRAGSSNYAAIGDVNADGEDEIILGAKEGHDPKIFIKNKSGKILYKKNGFYPFGGSGKRCGIYVASGDVNNDGKDEIIAGRGAPCPTTVKVFNKSGKALFKKKGFKPFSGDLGVTVAAGDVDGDNYDEIIVGAAKNKSLVKYYRVSEDDFSLEKSFKAFSGKPGVKVYSGDVDYDGRDEIVALRANDKKEIRVFNNKGKKKFRKAGWYPNGTGYKNYMRMAVGDVNADGYAEILTTVLARSEARAWSYKGSRTMPKVVETFLVGSEEFVVGRFK